MKSIFLFGTLKLILGGISLLFIARATFIIEANPAILLVCPMLLFTDAIAQNCFLFVNLLKAFLIAFTSIGSPNLVPVPWASIYEIVSGLTLEFFQVSNITLSCALTFGAVIPIDLPSWLIALPFITA